MVSERQIAANRRNAQKSMGPKSPSGKQRSSKNAYHHGLSVPMSVRSEAELKDLSRQFGGDATDAEILALAERAADAQLDLERVRKARVAMVECAWKLRASGAESWHPEFEELRHRFAQIGRREGMQAERFLESELQNPFQPLPGGNEEKERRFIDAVGRALSELTKTIAYEKRAAGRRDRAIRQIVSIKRRIRKTVVASSRMP